MGRREGRRREAALATRTALLGLARKNPWARRERAGLGWLRGAGRWLVVAGGLETEGSTG